MYIYIHIIIYILSNKWSYKYILLYMYIYIYKYMCIYSNLFILYELSSYMMDHVYLYLFITYLFLCISCTNTHIKDLHPSEGCFNDVIPPSEGCFSDVRGPFRTQNPKTSQTNVNSTEIVHTSDTLLEKNK